MCDALHRLAIPPVMKNIVTYLYIFILCMLPGTSVAVSFTADAVQIRGDHVSEARMFWREGNVRFEYEEDGVAMAQVFDNTNNKILWLDTDNKLYLQREMPEADKLISQTKAHKNEDPCKQFVGAECLFLKKAKINGREAEKWLITLNNNGNDFHIFQWVDTRYKNIIRQENSDGSGLTVDIEEDQTMNGRPVRKMTMTAYAANGEQRQGIQWYDNELEIVIKQQYQSDVVDELKNIKIQEIDASLFSVPESYRLFDDAIKTAQQTE